MSRDRIFALPRSQVGSFTFDESVVDVFPDMIARSVPGYASILSVIEQLAARYVQPGSNVYDLGCSLGAATLLIQRQAPQSATIHAIDSSAAMIRRLEETLTTLPSRSACDVRLHEADIGQVEICDASLVVLNFTLQFIPAEDRSRLLRSIFAGLRPGGALLLSEKICFDDDAEQRLLTDLHHDFKRANGYSDLEIAQKRASLENTLIPETLETHTSRMSSAGFRTVVPWFQCFNFVSILAVKSKVDA